MYTYTEYNRSITKSQVNKKYNDMPTIFFLSDNITAYFVIFCPCRRGYKIFSSMDASVGSLEGSLC